MKHIQFNIYKYHTYKMVILLKKTYFNIHLGI